MRHPYIYKVTKKDTGQFYIGSQCRGLEIGKNYFTSARSNKNSWLKKDLKENTNSYKIEIIKEFDDPDECLTEENKMIKENFNNPLILNDKYFNGEHLVSSLKYRTKEEKEEHIIKQKQRKREYDKQYVKNNYDKIIERDKKYRNLKETKERKREYDKHYRKINKEKIKNKKKEYNEKNKEIISLKKKEKYYNNKEAISLKRKEYYNQNKEITSLKRKAYKIIKQIPFYVLIYNNLEKNKKEKFLLEFVSKYNFKKRKEAITTAQRNKIMKKIKENNYNLYNNGNTTLKTFIINQYLFNDDNYILTLE